MKEISLWQFILKRLKAGRKVLLLVVVNSSGSSPGRAGFKMAVDDVGQLAGSIGGGIMEVKLVELAKNRLEKGLETPLLKRQIHQATAAKEQSGMICSGEQTVLFFPIHAAFQPVIQQILQQHRRNQAAVLHLRPALLQVLPETQLESGVRFWAGDETDFTYEEKIGCQPELWIVGGGHCALALSELMAKLDFQIRVLDDRPQLNTLAKNRFARQKIILGAYEQAGARIPSGTSVYVVVMTLGYRSDEIVVRQLLGKPLAYLGVLGSAAKMALVLERLRAAGYPPEQLNRIRTPIGLPICSRTPEEIAVSIAAEIIAVKNTALGDNFSGI
ncbi:MAG: XdhC family protein [Saprospiraceae bacterium]|nr:XdhC family protein [Saprospiraceae bacterium]